MARRSLQASAQGIQAIKEALKRKQGGQTYLAGAVHCSRQTIWSLLQGNPIDCEVFMDACNELSLKWEDIADVEPTEPEQNNNLYLDELVQKVRDRIRPIIQERCGTMRVLDMSQPIALGEIYTHVNILEKVTGRARRELADLVRDVSPENFERFSLGAVKETIPGLEAVEKHSKLMILGKPGAGKTTFLKHLAIQCIGGAFQSDRVPFFITLKEFAEADGKPDLMTFCDQAIPTSPNTQQILDEGRALILLDGLDEVRENDAGRVLRQIQKFSEQYHSNTFVITCRIAAREYTFQQFTEVEVADFDDAQIAEVSGKWFHCKQDEIKAERFLRQLKDNPPIRDLASSPLFLTLLCLVFEDSGDFPANRAELYQNGVDVLLKKWDSKRNIERDQIYKKLSLKRKEDLLSQIAWRTFEAGNYFFKQKDVEYQIREFIKNLPGASTDEETLNLDSEAVLKSIEAQHGLFVERARGIYSFSHLTFHEYFAAQNLITRCSPSVIHDPILNMFAEHTMDKRWREVILLSIGLLPSADVLLHLMKNQIDYFLAKNSELQPLLIWIFKRSLSSQIPCKEISLRVFYTAIAIDFDLYQAEIFFDAIDDVLNGIFALDDEIKGVDDFLNEFSYFFREDFNLTQGFEIEASALTHNLNRAVINSSNIISGFDIELLYEFENDFETDLSSSLKIFQASLSNAFYQSDFTNWWRLNWLRLKREVKSTFITYKSIYHYCSDLSEDKILTLAEYYEANKFLIACLNCDCYVSREVRQEIEDTLLLPIAEIEKRRKPDVP